MARKSTLVKTLSQTGTDTLTRAKTLFMNSRKTAYNAHLNINATLGRSHQISNVIHKDKTKFLFLFKDKTKFLFLFHINISHHFTTREGMK